ncbi:MAG: cache domain-containing protein [Nitrospira sp.]
MDQPARTGGLQKKFFFSLLVVGIVPGIAALIATYLYSTASLKQAIGDSFQEIARSTAIRLASAVDNEIDRAIRLALIPVQIKQRVVAANRRYQGRDEAGIHRLLSEEGAGGDARRDREQAARSEEAARYLREWAEQTGYYVRVMVADQQGVLVASTDPLTRPIQTDQHWWQEAMKASAAGSYVSSLILDPQLNDYVFEVAAPIRDDARERPIGAVGLVVRREVLTNTILPIHIGDTGHGMLLDTQGTPLICPVLPPTSHLIPEQLLNKLTGTRPIWLVAEDDAHGGRNAIVGAAPVRFDHVVTPSSLGGDHWYAFVRQAPEETYAPIYALLWTVGALGLALVITLASLGFAVGSRIVRPITSLQREAEAIRHSLGRTASGDEPPLPPAPQADYRTGDEIEDLARSFRAMRDTVEENLRTIKLQQHELIRREKLASVGQLLAALAHDLRNPLGVIRSSAQVILEKRQDDAVREEVARYIMDEVDKLSHRINDFLRYARQKPPDLRTIAVEDVARSALWQWQAQGGMERLRVETRFGSGLPAVRIDPEQMKEALVNLLMNAREAMPSGGRVTMTTRRGNNGFVEVEIKDTGPGITTAHLPRIFEPFFTTKEYGTGLGLTNVKRLVEDNGGILTVSSVEGSGSVFVTSLPAAA